MPNAEGPPNVEIDDASALGVHAPAPRESLEPRTVRPEAAEHQVRLRDSLGFATLVFTAVWVGWYLLGVIGTSLGLAKDLPKGVPGLPAAAVEPGWMNGLLAGNRADALWFERIAMDGYRTDDGSAAFFPLFPMLMHALQSTGIPVLAAGLLIAWFSYFGALAVLHALTTRELGAEVGRRASIYLAVFPTAFFLLAPFTEPLFLLLTLLAFWYARSGRWWLAIAPAMLAGLTRSVGIVLVLALAVEAAMQLRKGPILPRLLAPVAPAVGMGLYFLYWAVVRGDMWAPLNAQKNWGREWTLPAKTLYQAAGYAYEYQSWWLVDLVVVLVPLIAILAGIPLIRPAYTIFAAASLTMPLADAFMMRPLMSVPRFVVVLFPVFWVLAIASTRRWIPHSAIVGFFAGGFVLFGLLYMNSYPIF